MSRRALSLWSRRAAVVGQRRWIVQARRPSPLQPPPPRADSIVAVTSLLCCAAVLAEAHLRTDLSDAESPSECAYGPADDVVEERHARELEERGLVVIGGALSREALLAARRDVASRYAHGGGARDGSAGGFGAHGNEEDVRQDSIAWIRPARKKERGEISDGGSSEPSPGGGGDSTSDDDDDAARSGADGASASASSAPPEAEPPIGEGLVHCVDLIRGVASALERWGYAGSHSHRVPRQCQLAEYRGDGSSGYARHLDRCASSLSELGLLEWLRLSDYRGRAVTAILYLNDPERTERDGGVLRCWVREDGGGGGDGGDDDNDDDDDDDDSRKGEEAGSGARGPKFAPPVDVQPNGGSLVIFNSDRVEHMVLPSSKDRYALTVWVSGELGRGSSAT